MAVWNGSTGDWETSATNWGGGGGGGGGGGDSFGNDFGLQWQDPSGSSGAGSTPWGSGRDPFFWGGSGRDIINYDQRNYDARVAQSIADAKSRGFDNSFREPKYGAAGWQDNHGNLNPQEWIDAFKMVGLDPTMTGGGQGPTFWDRLTSQPWFRAMGDIVSHIPGLGQIHGIGMKSGSEYNYWAKQARDGGSPYGGGYGGDFGDFYPNEGSGGFDMGSGGFDMGGGAPGGGGSPWPGTGGNTAGPEPGTSGGSSGGGGGGGGGPWPGQGGPQGPNTYGYDPTAVYTSGQLQNQGGGAMPNGQQGAGAYDPFSPMNLWEPMSRDIDYQNARQNAATKEQFGSQGLRWSTPLMSAQSTLGRQTAQDKQKLMSQLMYQGAQDTYGRQRDSANMQMQLGNMQDRRDAELAAQLWGQGMQEQGMSNQDLAAYYNEFQRMNPDYIQQLLGGMLGPYSGQFKRGQNSADQWAPWLQALLAGGSSQDWSRYYGGGSSGGGGGGWGGDTGQGTGGMSGD